MHPVFLLTDIIVFQSSIVILYKQDELKTQFFIQLKLGVLTQERKLQIQSQEFLVSQQLDEHGYIR